MQTCRNALRTLSFQHGSHAGLLLSRYLREPVTEPKAKAEILLAAMTSLQNISDLYSRAYQQWEEKATKACLKETVKVEGRMVLGLGSESPLETGLRLHYTYGTPVIPGSALKGLAAHYCHRVWGQRDRGFLGSLETEEQGKKKTLPPGKHFEVLFGTTDDSGAIVFHDAMILPQTLEGSLALDIMTVHHGPYYDSGKKAPTDCDDPTPIAFLSVQGQFRLALQCTVDSEEGKRWEKLAMTLLLESLSDWGIGGKTNAGYGRMTRPPAQQPGASTTPTRFARYQSGDKVIVTRVEESQGKKDRIWLQAEDGICGTVLKGENLDIKIGDKIECWVKAVNKNPGNITYNFTTKAPQSHKSNAKHRQN